MTDYEGLQIAYYQALNSEDPSTQNGAFIVTRSGQRITGFNQIYWNIPKEYENREIKLQRIEHAERDVIYTAARYGFTLDRATMYCPWAACRECAKAIIASGIDRLVVHKQRMQKTHWELEGLHWLESTITVDWYDGPIDSPEIRINGQKWSPN